MRLQLLKNVCVDAVLYRESKEGLTIENPRCALGTVECRPGFVLTTLREARKANRGDEGVAGSPHTLLSPLSVRIDVAAIALSERTHLLVRGSE